MKLLVVEDEALLRHHLYTRLGESGHVVEAVADAEEALYQAGQYHFDLAIVDLGLPGISGLELITRLRSQDKTFPILILTLEATGRTRSKAWPPVPTTTWSSRFSSKSSKRGSMPCCAAPVASPSRPLPQAPWCSTSTASRPPSTNCLWH